MNKQNVYTAIKPIFEEVMDVENIEIHDELSAHNVPTWDSLAHVTFIVALESHFSIRFSIQDLSDLKNIGQLVDVILQKINAKSA
jgi:acyl carrier protein